MREYWDRTTEAFDAIYSSRKSALGRWLDRVFRWDMFARFEFSMRLSEPVADGRFLDAGCGSGWYALELGRRGARKVVGVDFSERMITLARERAEQEGLSDRVVFVVEDFLDYDPRERFDVALAVGYFDYVEDAGPVLRKLKAHAGRRVVASFPRRWTWRSPIRKARLGLKGCPVFFYSRSQLERLLKETGFERFEIVKIGQLWCVAGI